MIAANLSSTPGAFERVGAASSFCKAAISFCKFPPSRFMCPFSKRDSWPTFTEAISAISVSVFPRDFRLPRSSAPSAFGSATGLRRCIFLHKIMQPHLQKYKYDRLRRRRASPLARQALVPLGGRDTPGTARFRPATGSARGLVSVEICVSPLRRDRQRARPSVAHGCKHGRSSNHHQLRKASQARVEVR